MTIINPHTLEEVASPTHRGSYRPSPGRVMLIREEVAKQVGAILKPSASVEVEQAFTPFATVAAVGDRIPNGMKPWFEKGQVVTIEPSLLRPIEMATGFTVWNAPFSAVTGVFDEGAKKKPTRKRNLADAVD